MSKRACSSEFRSHIGKSDIVVPDLYGVRNLSQDFLKLDSHIAG